MESIALKSKNNRELKVERNSGITEFLIDRLVISSHKFIHLPKLKDIQFIRAENNYSRIFMADGTDFLASKTLKYMTSALQDKAFQRIHCSYLVNLDKIIGIKKNKGFFIATNLGQELPISSKYRSVLLRAIQNSNKK